MRDLLGPNPCVVVAHPDDETLWCGGLIASYPDLDWTIMCCSIPVADPIRAWLLHDAAKTLGASYTKVMPFPENPGEALNYLPGPRGYSCYVTHGLEGEYGHLHHKQIAKHVQQTADAPVIAFNLNGDSDYTLDLTLEAREIKLAALKKYAHELPYNGEVMPKWQALIHRYGSQYDLGVEGFDITDGGKPQKYQWHVLEDFINQHGYTKGAELGVRWGQTSRYVLENCPGVSMIGVDKMCKNPEATGDQESYDNWDWQYNCTEVEKIEAEFPDRFTMMRMDMSEASKVIEDGSLDFIFIDGDHSYEGVSTDIEHWAPKVRAGGVVAGHDINLDSVLKAVTEHYSEWETKNKLWNNCWWTYK